MDDVAEELKPLMRYERVDDTRTYCLRVVSAGVELWRVTESDDDEGSMVKEADLTSVDEALSLIEEIQRTLKAGGWRQV